MVISTNDIINGNIKPIISLVCQWIVCNTVITAGPAAKPGAVFGGAAHGYLGRSEGVLLTLACQNESSSDSFSLTNVSGGYVVNVSISSTT